jgi:transglutaminase-like putative cysteine protease
MSPMRLRIVHRTVYTYEKPLSYGLQELRLTPKSRPGQTVLRWTVAIEGGSFEVEFDDHHMNRVTLISFSGEGHRIEVTCEGEVETEDTAGIVGRHQGFTPLWLFERQTELTRAGAQVRRLVRGLAADFPEELPRLHELSRRVLAAITYRVGATDPGTSAEAALERGEGVCQDHAHVFIAAARAMGIPARYVSGYLMLDDRIHQQASHAWAEAHVDGLGWVGFDVSNGISPDARYIRVATGLDYREAAPVSGLRFGDHGRESLAVDIQVQQ